MAAAKELIGLKNIGKKLAARLHEAGIHSESDLLAVGAVEAHRRIKALYPDETLPVCYYLYSFEGALTGQHWNEISESRKQSLRSKLGSEQRDLES